MNRTMANILAILAVGFVATIIPACGGGAGGGTDKALAFQSSGGNLSIHEATAAGPFLVPGTAGAGGTVVTLKTWLFTPAPGEEAIRFVISGQEVCVPTGQAQGYGQQATFALMVTDAQGVNVASSQLVPLSTYTSPLPFYADVMPNLSGVRSSISFPSTGPLTISLVCNTYPYWSGDFSSLDLRIYAAPYTLVPNSTEIN